MAQVSSPNITLQNIMTKYFLASKYQCLQVGVSDEHLVLFCATPSAAWLYLSLLPQSASSTPSPSPTVVRSMAIETVPSVMSQTIAPACEPPSTSPVVAPTDAPASHSVGTGSDATSHGTPSAAPVSVGGSMDTGSGSKVSPAKVLTEKFTGTC